MISEYLELKMLPVNKSVLFSSPLEDKNTCLIRSGVINDDKNSFIHSILSSYSKEYYNLDKDERIKFLSKFKKSIFTKSNWKIERKDYEIFKENIIRTFYDIYKFISQILINDDEENIKKIIHSFKNKKTIKIIKSLIVKNIDLYDLIKELIPIDNIQAILNIQKTSSIEECKKYMKNNLEQYVSNIEILKKTDSKRYDFIIKNIDDLFYYVLKQSEEETFKNYLTRIKYLTCTLENIELISDKLTRNIYFIDSQTRLPFLLSDKQKFKYSKSIMILKIRNNNYEIIGKLLDGNKIKRDFDSNEIIIQKINMLLFNPEKIYKNYPELLDYIPSNFREDIREKEEKETVLQEIKNIKEDSKKYDFSDSDNDESDDDNQIDNISKTEKVLNKIDIKDGKDDEDKDDDGKDGEGKEDEDDGKDDEDEEEDEDDEDEEEDEDEDEKENEDEEEDEDDEDDKDD
jgi:hypothetical protein